QVVVSGAGYTGPQLYDYAFNDVEPLLEGIPGVASAAPYGGRLRQVNVVVDPVKSQARRVTASDVAAAAAQSNALLPSGELLAKGFDANVYTNAIPKRVATIGDATVKVINGKPVLIRDVARVEDGGTPETESVAVNGEDAVYLSVLRIPGGNTIEIVDAVKRIVDGLRDLPPGMQAKVYFDQSTFVRSAYHGLKKEVFQALALIALVILLFLQSVRGTLIVSVAIPLSFAITLIVLYATGQTLNAFTLGGLTLAMGRLVDDAVVVLEAIHRHQRMGMSAGEAALKGTNSVALPVLASTLTTMAVLLPVVLLAGLARKLFAPLAITVAVAMIASYFVSMAVTPVACRFFLGHVEHGSFAKSVEESIDRLGDGYAATLRTVLPYRATVVASAAVLVAAAGWAASRLPSTFFPEIDESMDTLYVRLAPGISVKDAALTMARMGKAITRDLPSGTVEMSIANVGMPQNARALLTNTNVAPNTGTLQLAFSDAERRTLSQGDLAVRIRDIVTRDFPGVEVLQYPGGLVASVFANGYTAPLVVEVHDDNLAQLDVEARAIAAVAREVPGVRDVKVSLQVDYPELHVDTDREMAGLVGTSEKDAAETTLLATLGNINAPGVWIDSNNGQSYYVVTSYDDERVTDAQAIGALPVRVSGQGRPVLLRAYGNVRRALGPVAVERNRLERVAHVLMQTEGRDLGSAADDLERAFRDDPATRHVAFRFVGQVELMRHTFGGLGLALLLAVMVVFMIMASQFKSLRLPFIILFTIPVSLLGIVLALMAAGQGFSITALMGVLMVIGIAVSNGILLVDDANRRFCDEGAEKVEAIVAAARSRFVPIAMTSLATVIGLVPTAMGLERGSEANQPLALAVVGGLTSSTLLSLFLVPVMFLYFAKRTSVA
ncbi:MAG TPA: efflux RND transporter permease subunit, partial [Polyangiaceae bacterium]|nr:efflux RND transporter permease subunit [Polyangiaceae bacterium]